MKTHQSFASVPRIAIFHRFNCIIETGYMTTRICLPNTILGVILVDDLVDGCDKGLIPIDFLAIVHMIRNHVTCKYIGSSRVLCLSIPLLNVFVLDIWELHFYLVVPAINSHFHGSRSSFAGITIEEAAFSRLWSLHDFDVT